MKKGVFSCIDAHTCGNPVRVITTGVPKLQGETIVEKRIDFIQNFDWIRKGLMFEPRGHDMMSGSIFYPPSNPENDASILFIETSGCLPMCGHGTIGFITIAIEKKLITPKNQGIVRLETPAGLVIVSYFQNEKEKVEWVKITNVPSFLLLETATIESSYLGELTFDIAYGGNFYAIFDSQKNFKGIQDYTAMELVQFSGELRRRINKKYKNLVVHPEIESINTVSHIMWTGDKIHESSSARNAVFYGDKAIDRSPCGTGTSARMAQLFAKGKLSLGEEFIHESFIGSTFTGVIENELTINNKKAIIPSIKGWAKIYGQNIISIDEEDDPYALGFQVI